MLNLSCAVIPSCCSKLAHIRRFIGARSMAALAGVPAFVPGLAGEDGRVTPHKPLSDKREYRIITLPNQLKVALVHDPAVDRSAACLSVGIGHLSDPWLLPGLSHFLEHMLFLGTHKFPEEASYKKFLKDHGGGSNASTSAEATTYHFFVHHASLLGQGAAFDRFSAFFTGPLMDPSATERELNAVDSENSKNLNDDGRREWQVRKHLSAAVHVFAKFGTGDRGTLSPPGVNVREALLQHYERYYSASIMGAALLGREDLDTLEAAARSGLEAVPDKGISMPVDHSKGHPYQMQQCGRVVYLQPVKDIRQVNITFPLPHTPFPDTSHASRLIPHTLGYEGKGSLLSALKEKGWASSLSAGCSAYRHCTWCNVEIDLTPSGLQHSEDVVAMVLQYCRLMQDAGTTEWERIHAELRQTAENGVRFKPTTEPVSAVTSLASNLLEQSPIDVLVGRSLLPAQPDLTSVRDILACLTPNNMIVIIAAQGYGPKEGSGCTTVKEPYYGFSYVTAPFTAGQRHAWGARQEDGGQPAADTVQHTKLPSGQTFPGTVDITPSTLSAAGSGLTLPPPNLYIPSDFGLLPPALPVRGDEDTAGARRTPVVEAAPASSTQSAAVSALQTAAHPAQEGDGHAEPVQVDVVVAGGGRGSPSSSADAFGSPSPSTTQAARATLQLLGGDASPWEVTAPGSFLSIPMRPEFASATLPVPALYPEPMDQDGTGPWRGVRVWHHQDNTFKLPKTYMAAHLAIPADKVSSLDITHAKLCASVLNGLWDEVLNEVTYDARCAGLGYGLDLDINGGKVNLDVQGYSHTLPVLLQTVLSKAARVHQEPAHVLEPAFHRLKDALVRRLANFTKAQPGARAKDLIAQYTQHPYMNREAALPVAEAITLPDVLSLADGLLVHPSSPGLMEQVQQRKTPCHVVQGVAPVPLEVLVSANTNAADADDYARRITSALPLLPAASVITPTVTLPKPRAVLLRPGSTTVITRPHPNPEEPNAAVEVVWQLGPNTARVRALSAMLAQAWSQPAFDTLRTKEQLGYIVHSGETTTGAYGEIVTAFISVQGQVASVDHLQARIESFVSTFRAAMDGMSEEDHKAKAEIVAQRMTEPTKTQREAHNRLSGPIHSGRYNWHGSEAVAAAIRATSLADLKHTYDAAILPQGHCVRKVVARVYAQPQASKAGPASDAPVHDGGPSRVPAPHPQEAPSDPAAFLGRVHHLTEAVYRDPTAVAQEASTLSLHAHPDCVGVWAPHLVEVPPSLVPMRMQ